MSTTCKAGNFFKKRQKFINFWHILHKGEPDSPIYLHKYFHEIEEISFLIGDLGNVSKLSRVMAP